ncbi:hypothetical protein FRC03_010641 [Tulasnella sp. 419]|nr:hypothetical protein FRC03_010641 [Tulasnella sp. 419]
MPPRPKFNHRGMEPKYYCLDDTMSISTDLRNEDGAQSTPSLSPAQDKLPQPDASEGVTALLTFTQ